MNATEVLTVIEVDAGRTVSLELVNMIHDVQLMRSALEGDQLEHANCLLLKLDHLLQSERHMSLDVQTRDAEVIAQATTTCAVTALPAIAEVDEEVLSAA